MRHCAAFFLVAALGCSHAPSQKEGSLHVTPECKSEAGDSRLATGDIFDVRVYEEQQLSGTYRVASDGTISFPLIGSIEVAGKSPPQIGQLIESKLSQGFLRSPQVSIFVKDYSSKKISVLGQVSKPGTFPYIDAMTVVEALTLAGGFTPIAAKNDAVVTRSDKSRLEVHLEAISDGHEKNVCLRPGDIVFVPERLF